MPIVVPATRAPSAVTATRFVKSREERRFSSTTSTPRSAATTRRVDVVDRLVGLALERAVQRGDGEQPRVVVGELAVHLDREPANVRPAERHREPAELRRERDVRPEHLEVVGAERRDVDGVRDEAALERRGDLLGDDHAGAILGLVGRGGEVRRHDDVRRAEQRTVVGLRDEDVERRAGDLARFESCDECVVVDEVAARGVDDPHAVAHLRDRVFVDRAARVVGQRQVQGQEVGAREHVVEREALDAELAEALGGDERVVRDDLHLQAERAPRHLAADPPEPEHAEHLVRELDATPLRPLPAALDERGVRLRDVARERNEQPDRVLGRRDDIRLGRVRDDDPAAGSGVDVDVVDPDAGAADHLQPRGGCDQSAVTLVAERTISAS